MSDLALTREDVEKVRSAAQKMNDRFVDTTDEDDEVFSTLVEFCDLLRGQDMEG